MMNMLTYTLSFYLIINLFKCSFCFHFHPSSSSLHVDSKVYSKVPKSVGTSKVYKAKGSVNTEPAIVKQSDDDNPGSFQNIYAKIALVEEQIQNLEKQCQTCEKEIKSCTDIEERKMLRKEKEQLRKEKEQLRNEKEMLLKKEDKLINLRVSKSSIDVPVQLRQFHMDELLPPMEVPPPSISSTDPTFVDEEWLSGSVQSVISHYESEDEDVLRVRPTAFIRCSRGGKTRALKEMARRLKSSLHASVIFVSFHDFTPIDEWEATDHIAALCRRIAFAARRNRSETYFANFSNADVKPQHIVEWLGNNPRILLIDELNVLEYYPVESKISSRFAFYLKKNFLMQKNQYFVFSSHYVSAAGTLATYLDISSPRLVSIIELPLIRKVCDAREIFNWPEMNLRHALFYGLVPALIYLARLENNGEKYLPFSKRDNGIDDCIKKGIVTNKSVRNLFSSFITGNKHSVLEPLHELMNTAENEKLRWIPFHMTEVLRRFASSNDVFPPLEPSLQHAMLKINKLFEEFYDTNENSGEAWEKLFLIGVIVRVLSGQFDKVILPLDSSKDYSISFNKELTSIVDVDEFVGRFTKPDRYPHIEIGQPKHAAFAHYDLIILVHESKKKRKLYAYQLKEGSKIPDDPVDKAKTKFEACVLMRGQSQGLSRSTKNWIIPSTSQIKEFFGESGKHWTPEEWRKLMSSPPPS